MSSANIFFTSSNNRLSSSGFLALLVLFHINSAAPVEAFDCFLFGTPRCGFLSLGSLMRSADPNANECTETCVLLPFWALLQHFFNPNAFCGECNSNFFVDVENNPNEFNVGLNIGNVPAGDDRDFFINSAMTWKSVITDDTLANPFPSETIDEIFENEASQSFAEFAGCGLPDDGVDDVFICAVYEEIDQEGGILGAAGPLLYTVATSLPFVGRMIFDTAGVAQLKTGGGFGSVVLHEMAHVLGIGTMWDTAGLSEENGGVCSYTGSNANSEFLNLYTGTGCSAVPLENEFGPGTRCGHWDEDCLDTELVTGFGGSGSAEPLSRITIAGLADLGYTVDYNLAEPYTITASCAAACSGQSRRRLAKLSPQGAANAVAYGKSLLKVPVERGNDETGMANTVVVFVEENGTFFEVFVKA